MQHERAAIMALTFCIGFTTAFIGYGIPTTSAPIAVTPVSNTQTASLADTQPARIVEPSYTTGGGGQPASRVSLDTDGLWFIVAGEEYLVSPSTSLAPDIQEAHTDIHQALARTDSSYLFFCAETLETAGLCEPRVFDLANFRIHQVQSQGQTGTLDPATMQVTWLADGRLSINGFTSAAATMPWQVE